MRRTPIVAAVVLGAACALVPGAGYAADLPVAPQVIPSETCVGSEPRTETVIYDGEAVTLTFDDFGTCLGDGGVTLASSPGGSPAAPAVPVGAQPTFTG